MADELKLWATKKNLNISEFHVIGSGNILHSTSDLTRIATSQNMLSIFCSTLQRHFPDAMVYIDASGQPDEDFIKMVVAPMLFTSHGSFALAAVIANSGEKATPACENLNFPGNGQVPASQFQPNWHLYHYCVANTSEYTSNKLPWDIPGR
jgi:hypothetical protein